MGKTHVIAIPCPAQGHVIPLMEVAQCLAENGVKVTFVNSDFYHERIIKAMPQTGINDLIHLVSIPDGLEVEEDRNDLGKLTESMLKVMPGKLETLIEKIIQETEDEETLCILTDYYMGWALDVAEKFGAKKAAFLPAAVALSALTINADKLINDGIIDNNGTPLKKLGIRFSPTMPEMNPGNFTWACTGDFNTQKIIFKTIIENNESLKLADFILCNSSYYLEPGAFPTVPNSVPIGPLLASNRLGKSVGHFWPEDSSCLLWLDQHPANSVIYVAFGSFTVFDQTQFQELALGLELTNRPFLWVVSPDLTLNTCQAYPKGFEERIKNIGKMVGWAPQQRVLSHPSIACFITHCGWNSTMEGISNGVPFLCWPYFADQFLNQTYICDEWKVGLRLSKDGGGIISREEIKSKVENLEGDQKFKERVVEIQAKTMGTVRGGSSEKNFNKFLDWIGRNDVVGSQAL